MQDCASVLCFEESGRVADGDYAALAYDALSVKIMQVEKTRVKDGLDGDVVGELGEPHFEAARDN